MKPKRLCLLLALLAALLLLAGCGDVTPVETQTPVTLPAPIGEPPATVRPVPTAPGEELLPTLETRAFSEPTVTGPAGNVLALYYRKIFGNPVYGDVDGDGRRELVYNSYGASEGDVLDAIFVYDLEDGWPVQEGCSVFSIGGASCELVEENGQVCYSYRNKKLGYEEPLLLPVTVTEDNVVYLNGNELPEGLELLDGGTTIYGLSFRWLRERVADRAVASEKNYLIWREPGVLYTEEQMGGEQASFVAAANNGMTVTGRVGWFTLPDGSHKASSGACKVYRAETVIGKTEQELIHLYGEPAFELLRSGDGFTALCWFTEKGKLMTVQIDQKAISASFTELPIEDAP